MRPRLPAIRKAPSPAIISVILPVYNEAKVLSPLARAVVSSIVATGNQAELIFVNDGSRDRSGPILDKLARIDDRIRVVHLSRNFGHQAAIQAGLAHAGGHAVVVMDCDMQDEPASIGGMIEKWREGFDVVYAIRTGRKEGFIKRLLFYAFYRLLDAVAVTPMPLDAGNFGLLDAQVARELAALGDHDRYFAGLRSWVGYRQVGIPVERGPRYDQQPRVSLSGLFRLAKSAIFSFSYVPLGVFYVIGFVSLLVFTGLAAFIVYHKAFTALAIPGWASTTMTGSFFGALNALGIAILGEYVSRIYDQVRDRPLYLVDRIVNGRASPRSSSASVPTAKHLVATHPQLDRMPDIVRAPAPASR